MVAAALQTTQSLYRYHPPSFLGFDSQISFGWHSKSMEQNYLNEYHSTLSSYHAGKRPRCRGPCHMSANLACSNKCIPCHGYRQDLRWLTRIFILYSDILGSTPFNSNLHLLSTSHLTYLCCRPTSESRPDIRLPFALLTEGASRSNRSFDLPLPCLDAPLPRTLGFRHRNHGRRRTCLSPCGDTLS